MGAWGYKNLENDTACDWLWELKENPTMQFVEETLDTVLNEEEYLGSDHSPPLVRACSLHE